MRKTLLTTCFILLGTVLGNITASEAYVLTKTEKRGDSMGTTTAISSSIENYYDENNMLISILEYRLQQDNTMALIYRDHFENEDGLLKLSYGYQWQAGYLTWNTTVQDSTGYEYDADKRLSKKTIYNIYYGNIRRYINEYTWEGNNLVQDYEVWDGKSGTEILPDQPLWRYTTTYSDFLPGFDNKPLKMKRVAAESYNEIYENYTYDEKGRRTSMERYMLADDAKKAKEEYKYDDRDVIIEQINYVKDSSNPENWKYSSKTTRVYDAVSGIDTCTTYSWNSTKQEWTAKLPSYEYYQLLNSETAPRNLSVVQEPSVAAPGAVRVTCDEPIAAPANAAYIIWRGWIAADTVKAENGKISYLDEGATRGHYNYYVQSMDEATGEKYNCSLTAAIDVTIDLPAATNIRAISGKIGDAKSEAGAYQAYMMNIVWDAPACPYPAQYQVYEVRGENEKLYQMSDVLSEGAYVYHADINLGKNEQGEPITTGSFTLVIRSIFEYGQVDSEPITIEYNYQEPFEEKLSLVQIDKHGDAMGTSTGITGIESYFYNSSDMLIRKIEWAGGNKDVNEIEYAHYYENNEHDLLERYYYYQWRYQQQVWKIGNDSIEYKYDDLGRLIESTNYRAGDRFVYTYKEDLLTQVEKLRVQSDGSYKNFYTEVYSDYVAGTTNQPQTITSTGLYSTYAYVETRTYDTNGNILTSEKIFESGSKKKTEYTYDIFGICVNTSSYNGTDDGYEPASVTLRESLGNNQYRVTTQTWFAGEWEKPSTSKVEHYAVLDKTTAPTDLTVVDISTDEAIVMYLNCNVPENAPANAKYIIWRNYLALDTVAAIEGKITYTDNTATLGNLSYFVQTYDEATNTTYNCSKPAIAEKVVTLAPVTNIRIDSGEKKTIKNPETGDSYTAYVANLVWDAPASNYIVKGYKIYEIDGVWEILLTGTELVPTTSYELEMMASSMNIRVDAIYEIGIAKSEVTTVSIETKELLPPTNLRKTGQSELTTNESALSGYYIYIAWDAPVDATPDQYRIYQDGELKGTTTETTDQETIFVLEGTTSVTVKVTALYLDNESEGVEVPFEVTALETITLSKAYVADNNLYAPEAAKVAIYNAAGAKVADHQNETCISLAGLTEGVYIARVEVAGTVQIIKFTR